MYCRLLERGTQASTSAVTASTSGANIAYWSLLGGKSGPPTEAGRFVHPEPPMRTRLDGANGFKVNACECELSNWTLECQKAFVTLKQKRSLLAHPHSKRPFVRNH